MQRGSSGVVVRHLYVVTRMVALCVEGMLVRLRIVYQIQGLCGWQGQQGLLLILLITEEMNP